jgi:hypothetical protein
LESLIKHDGFVKNLNSALRCILHFFKVQYVRIITQDLRALNLELFSLPKESEVLIVCHIKLGEYKDG